MKKPKWTKLIVVDLLFSLFAFGTTKVWPNAAFSLKWHTCCLELPLPLPLLLLLLLLLPLLPLRSLYHFYYDNHSDFVSFFSFSKDTVSRFGLTEANHVGCYQRGRCEGVG